LPGLALTCCSTGGQAALSPVHRARQACQPIAQAGAAYSAPAIVQRPKSKLPGEQLRVSQPLPPPSKPAKAQLFPDDLVTVSLPVLQALLTRFDLTAGDPRRCRVRNWASYDERMSYIANVFRSRQQCVALFSRPFTQEVEVGLLKGTGAA
jgi:hypothetical protein